MRIFKYVVPVADGRINVSMPVDAVIKFVGLQQAGQICIWAEVINEDAMRARTFMVFGTGHEIPMRLNYRGTVLDGLYVWHLYEDEAVSQ